MMEAVVRKDYRKQWSWILFALAFVVSFGVLLFTFALDGAKLSLAGYLLTVAVMSLAVAALIGKYSRG